MAAVAPGTARSNTGAQTTSIPAAPASSPISAPVNQAARSPAGASAAYSAPIAAAGGWARQCGGPQPGDAPALLVDHQHCQRRQQPRQMPGQRAKLVRVDHVAGEQDHPRRAVVPDERDLLPGQDWGRQRR